jgi:hypothetical protein
MDAFPPPREPHYARLCSYLKTHSSVEPQAHAFEAAQLQNIERQLAGFIGPVAKHLVKTAALHASGISDLVQRLASELDTDVERREFVQRCRR